MKTDLKVHSHESWSKRKRVGQKAPIKLKEIWAIATDGTLSTQG